MFNFFYKCLFVIAVCLSVCLSVCAQQSVPIASLKVRELAPFIVTEGLNPDWYAQLDEDKAIERIAEDLYLGRVKPNQLNPQVRIDVKSFPHSQLVRQFLVGKIGALEFVFTAKAKNSQYQQAVQLFNNLLERQQQGKWTDRPSDLVISKIELNSKNLALLFYLRQKLNDFGYRNETTHQVFDENLKALVQSFQNDHHLKPDGIVGKISWSFLERPLQELLTQARLNIDRARWLPDNLGSSHILVNLAQQRLQFFENRIKVMDFKTINGRLDRQSPLLVDQLRSVILNPTWTVPYSIFVKDKLPALRENPGYLASNHMKLFDDLTDKEVDPYQVDWSLPDDELDHYTIVQSPGPWNALGFLKFTLNNPYAIYLHDTNERALFEQDLRLFSSGCVRVSKPFELAEKLLNDSKWSVEALKNFTENAPTVAEIDTRLKPKIKLPVYLLYITLFNDADNGHLISLNDHYGLDQLHFQLMNP